MSGRDLVDDLRSGVKPAPRAARGVGVLDIVLTLVTVAAVVGAGFFGYLSWMTPHSASPVTPDHKAPLFSTDTRPASVIEAWSDTDDSRCLARARAEANSDGPQQVVSPNPSLAPGFAGLATLLECKLTRKVSRFCSPEQKAKLVEAVNDYLTRRDLIVGALGLQGAPMAIVGQFVGGEAAMGSDIYESQRDDVLAFMQIYNKRVADALKALAREGLVAPSDFAGFMSGPPETIKVIFGSAVAERNACA